MTATCGLKTWSTSRTGKVILNTSEIRIKVSCDAFFKLILCHPIDIGRVDFFHVDRRTDARAGICSGRVFCLFKNNLWTTKACTSK